MRAIVVCLCVVLWHSIVLAEDFVTTDGVTYSNARVTRVSPTCLSIMHRTGIEQIPFDKLPEDIQQKYGYSKENEDRHKQKMAKAAEDRRRLDYLKSKASIVSAEFRQVLADVVLADVSEYSVVIDDTLVQKTNEGSLTVGSKLERVVTTNYVATKWSGPIYISDIAPECVDGDVWVGLIWCIGTFEYTTVLGETKRVRKYTTSAREAYSCHFSDIVIGANSGLHDDQEPGAVVPSSGMPAIEPVLADRQLKGFGSGFIVTRDGYLLTNHHVVQGAKQVKVKTEKGVVAARIVAQDPDNDIALLKIDGEFSSATFAADKVAQLGQTVFTVGFPMPELQGFSPKVTKGVISSMRGIHDDIRMYQIDAAVQPGNSGGPLADESGNIVGVVVARISDSVVAETTGALAQNVNYAVKKSYAIAFLDNEPHASKQIQTAKDNKEIPFEEAVERIRKATVLVMVY